jgi:serine/threonine-protein kinase
VKNLIDQSIGRYHILEKLGQGGMAMVFKAFDTRLEREVAIKIIRTEQFGEELLDRILKRFEREAKTLARLTHPNIVGIIDYGEFQDSPYLVMEYLPSGTLKQQITHPFPYQQAGRILIPIAKALDFAHRMGILHRDVKPSNILITQDGDPMLTDFGIARILEETNEATLTGTGVGIGTPEYMAPEQWVGKSEAASDQYSLAVVFYELITGSKPYTADTPAAILLKQATDPLPRPRNFVADLPVEVEQILFKALNRDPKNRFSTMADFAQAMEEVCLSKKDNQNNGLAGTTAFEKESSMDVDQHTDHVIRDDSPIDMVTQIEPEVGQDTVISGKSLTKNTRLTLIIGLILVAFTIASILIIPRLFTFGKNISNSSQSSNLQPTAMLSAALENTGSQANSRIRDKDKMEMAFIPTGDFFMGSDTGSLDERPSHVVSLDAYWMDKTEVTNLQYKQCVIAGICEVPTSGSSYSIDTYYENVEYNNYPMLNVNWKMANKYCEWVGARLPTEAEWEKAARGLDGRQYPWGNNPPQSSLANYDQINGDTVQVGQFPEGASPYGIYDMAGNVWEWVSDIYGEKYYQESAKRNPTGPTSGNYYVIRGGAWNTNAESLRAANRDLLKSYESMNIIGFRCVQSE